MHWQRWRHNGDPSVVRLVRHSSPEASFAANTRWNGSCLLWTASAGSHGYGRIHVGGTRVLAHRYAWERAHGPLPAGAVIDHKCHNRLCVNHEHLRIATPSENNQNRSGSMPTRKYDLPRNVYRTKGGRYYVSVGRRRFGGVYDTVADAEPIAAAARREMFGDFAGRG